MDQDYLPQNLEDSPYAVKLNVGNHESFREVLSVFNGVTKDSYRDDTSPLLVMDAYGVPNGGIDDFETLVDNRTFFEPENFYSIYPGSGRRQMELEHPENHHSINPSEKTDWTGRDQSLRKLLTKVVDEHNLEEDTLFYLTDMAAYDTSTPRNTTVPETEHILIQDLNGYSVFLDWEESTELDQMKIPNFNLEDWKPENL